MPGWFNMPMPTPAWAPTTPGKAIGTWSAFTGQGSARLMVRRQYNAVMNKRKSLLSRPPLPYRLTINLKEPLGRPRSRTTRAYFVAPKASCASRSSRAPSTVNAAWRSPASTPLPIRLSSSTRKVRIKRGTPRYRHRQRLSLSMFVCRPIRV
jgi:hypothetical protein